MFLLVIKPTWTLVYFPICLGISTWCQDPSTHQDITIGACDCWGHGQLWAFATWHILYMATPCPTEYPNRCHSCHSWSPSLAWVYLSQNVFWRGVFQFGLFGLLRWYVGAFDGILDGAFEHPKYAYAKLSCASSHSTWLYGESLETYLFLCLQPTPRSTPLCQLETCHANTIQPIHPLWIPHRTTTWPMRDVIGAPVSSQ